MCDLAAAHPGIEIAALTANAHAGQAMREVFPHLAALAASVAGQERRMSEWSAIDVAFCGLPHATSQEVIAALPPQVKVIDMSADFRLRDPSVYQQWYGKPHRALELQKASGLWTDRALSQRHQEGAAGGLPGLLSDGGAAGASSIGG